MKCAICNSVIKTPKYYSICGLPLCSLSCTEDMKDVFTSFEKLKKKDKSLILDMNQNYAAGAEFLENDDDDEIFIEDDYEELV